MTIETLSSLKLSFFILGFILFFLLETIYPNRQWDTNRYKRLAFHTTFALINTIIMRLPVLFVLMPTLLIVSESHIGLLYSITEYDIVKLILSFIVLDLALYWWHRFNHTNQFLWKFHFVHHVDTHMDVGTSVRFHIGELILSTFYKSIIIFVFGISLAESGMIIPPSECCSFSSTISTITRSPSGFTFSAIFLFVFLLDV